MPQGTMRWVIPSRALTRPSCQMVAIFNLALDVHLHTLLKTTISSGATMVDSMACDADGRTIVVDLSCDIKIMFATTLLFLTPPLIPVPRYTIHQPLCRTQYAYAANSLIETVDIEVAYLKNWAILDPGATSIFFSLMHQSLISLQLSHQ